jgi:dUTP pyrophosphatase
MEKEKIGEYIKKLKQLEVDLGTIDDEDVDNDVNFIKELDGILLGLNNDINTTYGSQSLTNTIPVKFKKIYPNAVTPKYSKEGDAGMDLTITSIIDETDLYVTYGFGIAMEIPFGHVGLIFPRSSIRKYDLSLTNCVGVIDSGYRGELQATFKKTNGLDSVKYNVDERGGQIIILPYPQINFIETDELTKTVRGEGGFGSSGN